MTIDEAITRYEESAKQLEGCADRIDELKCDSTTTRQSVEFHKQLAEWLRELKAYRIGIDNLIKNETFENMIALESLRYNFLDGGEE